MILQSMLDGFGRFQRSRRTRRRLDDMSPDQLADIGLSASPRYIGDLSQEAAMRRIYLQSMR